MGRDQVPPCPDTSSESLTVVPPSGLVRLSASSIGFVHRDGEKRIAAQIVDKYGNVLPYQTRTVAFSLAGDARLVGENPLPLPQIIAATPGHEDILDAMIERIDNIICLEDSIRDLPAVIFDRAAAAYMAVEHLIKLGHQHIAFLAIDDQRRLGYKQALLENNLPYDEGLIRVLAPMEPARSAYRQTLELFESNKTPTALFAANDEAGIAAIAALHDQGRRVPDDVAITSIDDIELASMIRPALTTASSPKHEVGTYAIQLLISRREILSPNSASMVLPVELIVRDSCGARR